MEGIGRIFDLPSLGENLLRRLHSLAVLEMSRFCNFLFSDIKKNGGTDILDYKA